MMITARFARTLAALSLLLAAGLSLLWVALQPPVEGTSIDQLAALNAAGGTAAISAFAFCVAQLPFMIGALGIAQLARGRAPILAILGGSLAVLGGFGHAVFGGFQLSQLSMAADTANHALYAGLLDGPPPLGLLVMMTVGTLGTVVGLLILGIAIMRAQLGPRWVPYTLWAFILVEFVGTNFTAWASLVSGLLYLAAFAALAVTVWRSPLAAWQSEPFSEARIRTPKSVVTR